MSTKIYYAWKIPVDKLNDFIDFIRPEIYERAKELINGLYSITTTETEEFKKYKTEHQYYSDSQIKLEMIFNILKKVSAHDKRCGILDVDFGLNIWIYENYCYIIPIAENKDISVPDYAEDFSYWNNTDQPDHITDAIWDYRAKTWEQINCGEGTASHNARRLYHSVINLSARYGDFDFENYIRHNILDKEKESS